MAFNFYLGALLFNPYLRALLIFIVSLAILYIFKNIVIGKLKEVTSKTKTKVDNLAFEVVEKVGWPFYFFLALYVSLRFVSIPDTIQKGVYYVILVLITYYIIRVLGIIVDHIAHIKAGSKEKDGKAHEAHVTLVMGKIVKGTVWVIAIIFLLSNLGFNVSSLIAGLGIGGIAIALALQNILGDLFSSISIYLDKPFEVGDFIIIGTDKGTIKKIGVKSTRVQTLDGQELVVPNRELTNTRINNYKKMKKRRVVFSIGVTYSTSHAKLKKIPGLIKDIVKKEKLAEFNRAHFKQFGPYSLDFEIVYTMKEPEYDKYRDTQQRINLAIVNALEKEKVEFAFPTQSIYLEK
ncbi:mechanosensitive ion channel family protein [Nanoarchaeota archaeon]